MRFGAHLLAWTLAAAMMGALVGCEEEQPAPSNAGGPLDNVAENPGSILGKSARMGLDLKDQVEQRDQAVGGMADEIGGAAAAVNLAGLTWSAPAGWKPLPPRPPFRTAQFSIPGDGGDATISFWVPDNKTGGGVAMNLDRWEGQVQSSEYARRDTLKVAGHTVSTIESEGTYNAGMGGGGPQPDWAMRGAIVEGPDGNVFIKLVGPRSTIEGAQAQWDAFIGGMRNQ